MAVDSVSSSTAKAHKDYAASAISPSKIPLSLAFMCFGLINGRSLPETI